jgi:hypothetical protein
MGDSFRSVEPVPGPPLLLLKGDPANLRPPKVGDRLGERGGAPRIRCPACAWEPRREDQWTCGCDHSWNTFDTGGVCPACGRRWAETQCPKCHVWSRHDDWYADDPEEGRLN